MKVEGWKLNHKRTYRIYKEEKLDLGPRHRKRLRSQSRGRPVAAIVAATVAATAAHEMWSMDFTSDMLCDGRSFRTLNVIDVFTRRCLSIETDINLGSERVVRVMKGLVQQHGKPKMLQIDNGPEFRGKELDQWASKAGVELHFIDPGKPTQNGHIESFNGRFREECLSQEWFTTLSEARQIIEAWRVGYNTMRPHSRLGYLPPEVWAQRQEKFSI